MSTTNSKITGIYDAPVYEITDAGMADHGDASVSGSIAATIALINAKPTVAERRGAIVLSAKEYTATTKITFSDNIAIVGAGRGQTLINLDDTSGGIYFNNGIAHTDSSSWTVGQYAIPGDSGWPWTVKFRCTTAGTSDTAADFTALAGANTTVGDVFTDGGGVDWECVPYAKGYVGELSFEMSDSMTGYGIEFSNANHSSIGELYGSGGSSTSVALHISQSNKIETGSLDFEVGGSGVLIDIDNATVFPYNYGDLSLKTLDVSLGTTKTYGIKCQSSTTTADVVNNIRIGRFSCAGDGVVTEINVGIWMEGARRCSFGHVDIEGCVVGVLEIGSGNGLSCIDNSYENYSFLPSGDPSTQDDEATEYARGIPFQAAVTTPYTTVNVREDWMTWAPFDAWTASPTNCLLIADDEGSWTRSLSAIGSPSGGLVALTIAAAPNNSSFRDSIARHPTISQGTDAAFASNPNIQITTGNDNSNVNQLQGDTVIIGSNSANGYQSLIYKILAKGKAAYRLVRGEATGLQFDLQVSGGAPTNPRLTPEASTANLYIDRIVAPVLTAEPSTTQAGLIVSADGSTWNPSGSTASSATTDASGYAVGITTVTLASAGAGTLAAGGVITFAGDTTKYKITVGDADVSNGGTIVFEPGLAVALGAGAVAITVAEAGTWVRNGANNAWVFIG